MNLNHQLKILMFGWEFPPHNSGGLGVACKGLANAIVKQGATISFVLPKKMNCDNSPFKFIFPDNNSDGLEIKNIDSLLSAYVTSESYQKLLKNNKENGIYGYDLFNEVRRYGQEARKIALKEKFDIIHAHDWLSIPAGIEAKKVSNKPLIVQVHATEFDRTGGNNVNQQVYEIEKQGLSMADKIITVSKFTKKKVVRHYHINPEKIEVVYNAIKQEPFISPKRNFQSLKKGNKKIVLFLGRITLQKGPDYFLRTAKKVLERNSDVFFIVAGSGDMKFQMIEESASLGIADKVLFTDFLRGEDLISAYQSADLFVMPSVSEPFGLTPLESLLQKTPVLISKQSGVSEILSHSLKADFWDIDEMANKILSVLKYPALCQCLSENGNKEVKEISWQDSAIKCLKIYNQVLA
jgi:glycosyltransferase involved in cell wall biosynthesis